MTSHHDQREAQQLRERAAPASVPTPVEGPVAPPPRSFGGGPVGWLVGDRGEILPLHGLTWLGSAPSEAGAQERRHCVEGLHPTHACLLPVGTGLVVKTHRLPAAIVSNGQPPRMLDGQSLTGLDDGDILHLGPVRLRWTANATMPDEPIPPPEDELTAVAAASRLYRQPFVSALLAAAARTRGIVAAVDVGLRDVTDDAPAKWELRGASIVQDLPVERASVVVVGPSGVSVPLENRRPVPWGRVRQLRYGIGDVNQQFEILSDSGRIEWAALRGVPTMGTALLGAAAMAWRAAAPDVWQQARAAHSADLRQRHGFPDTGPADDASHEALLLRTRPPLVRGDFHMVT